MTLSEFVPWLPEDSRKVTAPKHDTLTVGSLFSGIGGLDLGLERAGMRIIWQAECDPFRRRVLAEHWPGVPCVFDVRAAIGLPRPDVLAGGFPCQDFSHAASGWRRPGFSGRRSGLWRAFHDRIIEYLPQWVVVENVDAAWGRWVPVVRRTLHDIGYASVPLRVSAQDVGAPFQGRRVFVIATPYRDSEPAFPFDAETSELPPVAGYDRESWGQPPPRALGMANGVSDRMDRVAAVGDAVVPRVAEYIGRMIISHAQPV